jgi:hypothetical protein
MRQSLHFGRIFGALALGGVVAFMPRVTLNFSESGVEGTIRLVAQCVQLPGAAVGLIVFRDVHGISLWVVEAANVIFYSGLFYFLLATWAKHKTKS